MFKKFRKPQFALRTVVYLLICPKHCRCVCYFLEIGTPCTHTAHADCTPSRILYKPDEKIDKTMKTVHCRKKGNPKILWKLDDRYRKIPMPVTPLIRLRGIKSLADNISPPRAPHARATHECPTRVTHASATPVKNELTNAPFTPTVKHV